MSKKALFNPMPNLFINPFIENLTNLEAVTEPVFQVYCFPLSMEKAEAVPARVLVEF